MRSRRAADGHAAVPDHDLVECCGPRDGHVGLGAAQVVAHVLDTDGLPRAGEREVSRPEGLAQVGNEGHHTLEVPGHDARDHVAVARDDDLAGRAVHLHVVDEDPPEVRHRDVLEFESRLGVAQDLAVEHPGHGLSLPEVQLDPAPSGRRQVERELERAVLHERVAATAQDHGVGTDPGLEALGPESPHGLVAEDDAVAHADRGVGGLPQAVVELEVDLGHVPLVIRPADGDVAGAQRAAPPLHQELPRVRAHQLADTVVEAQLPALGQDKVAADLEVLAHVRDGLIHDEVALDGNRLQVDTLAPHRRAPRPRPGAPPDPMQDTHACLLLLRGNRGPAMVVGEDPALQTLALVVDALEDASAAAFIFAACGS